MVKIQKTEILNARVSLYDKQRLVSLCNGNVSRGIREALALYFSAKSEEAGDKAEALDEQSISV